MPLLPSVGIDIYMFFFPLGLGLLIGVCLAGLLQTTGGLIGSGTVFGTLAAGVAQIIRRRKFV